MRILVVDDEPDVATLVRMGIAYQRPEYEIVESNSGTSTRCPRPSRSRAISAITIETAAAMAPKVDEMGTDVKRALPAWKYTPVAAPSTPSHAGTAARGSSEAKPGSEQ